MKLENSKYFEAIQALRQALDALNSTGGFTDISASGHFAGSATTARAAIRLAGRLETSSAPAFFKLQIEFLSSQESPCHWERLSRSR